MDMPLVLEYGQEEVVTKEKQHPLGTHARTPDNRRFYYSQAQDMHIPRGAMVAAPVMVKDSRSVFAGGPKEEFLRQVVRIGIVPDAVGPHEYFWCLTWGPGEALFDWMTVDVDLKDAMKQSGVLGWAWDSDSGDYRIMYVTTAA